MIRNPNLQNSGLSIQ